MEQEKRASLEPEALQQNGLYNDNTIMLSDALQHAKAISWRGSWAITNEKGEFDNDPVNRSGDLHDFVQDLLRGKDLAKKEGPGFIGASLGDHREKVSLRNNKNVLARFLLSYDFDHKQFGDIERTLKALHGLLMVLHTSFKHGVTDKTTGKPDTRFRVHLPLKRSISTEEHGFLWKWGFDLLAAVLSSEPDTAPKAASNFFNGFRAQNPDAVFPRQFKVIDGDPLCPDNLPDGKSVGSLAASEAKNKPISKPVDTSNPGSREKAYALGALKRACEKLSALPAGARHDPILKESKAIGGLLWAGISFEEAETALGNAAIASGHDETDSKNAVHAGLTEGQTLPREIPEQSSEGKIKELAKLTPLEYEQARINASDELGIRASMLDKIVKAEQKQETTKDDGFFSDIEPWEEPVNGADLLNEMLSIFQRFVIADTEALISGVLWTVLTWITDYASVLPLCVITAPEKACGKTVMLSVIGELARKPLPSSAISASSLFRSIQKWNPTILLDEADCFYKENEELRALLNSGHTRKTAFIIKSEEINGKWEPVPYPTFCAKALAGIRLDDAHKGLPDTVLSRAIIIPMRRKIEGEKTENLRHASDVVFEPVRRKLSRWASDNGVKFAGMRPTISRLSNRDADNWEPLIAIADLIGGEWLSKTRKAIFELVCGEEKAPSMNEKLLADIQEVFQNKKVAKITTADLIKALCSDEEKPWATFNKGFTFKPIQLSQRLKGFGIHPKNIRLPTREILKGYVAEDFKDSFKRYLHASGGVELAATPLQASDNADLGGSQNATTTFNVADKKELKQASLNDVADVADKKGGGEDIHTPSERITVYV